MKQYQLGEFEEIVLLTVGILDGKGYGISIKDEIEDRIARTVSVGALQVTLHRLEKKGFVSSKHGEASAERRGRPKLYFTLTAYGKMGLSHSRDIRTELWNALPQSILNLTCSDG